MSTIITPEQPDSPDATLLITELESVLEPYYPTESRHGYSVEKLLREGVAFFVARYDGLPAGCGGVQFFGGEYGELKRMFVRPQYRGLGIGKQMVTHLAEYTRQHNITTLRLETGIYQDVAIGLYEAMGFRRIPPFGPYHDDPLSVCYEKALNDA